MRNPVKLLVLRYSLLSIFSALGAYYFVWFLQSASFSVAAEPIASAIYKTRAEFCLPVSILLFAVGGLFFICLRSFSCDKRSA